MALAWLMVALLTASSAVTHGAVVPIEDAVAKLLDPIPLLRRCPCVPINTCYSQGVSLNEQEFLNSQFQCPDFTQNHCCGPYFPTLGSKSSSTDDFYFDGAEEQQQQLGKTVSAVRVVVVMAQNATTADPLEPRVVTVLPEVTTTELRTTTEIVTVSTSKPEEPSTTTEAVTVPSSVATTTTTKVPVTSTTTKPTIQPTIRLGKLHKRGRLSSTLDRKFHATTTTTTKASPTTTTTTIKPTSVEPTRRYPKKTGLYNADFRLHYMSGRLRSYGTSSHSSTTTPGTTSPRFRRPANA